MSDFEHNIRASWLDIFPSVKAKGCHFHYAKVSSVLYNTVHHFLFSTIFFFSYLSEEIAYISLCKAMYDRLVTFEVLFGLQNIITFVTFT